MSRLIIHAVLAALTLVTVNGCTGTTGITGGESPGDRLKLPPDLSPDKTSTLMSIPGEATADDQQSDTGPVLPKPDGVTVHRDGNDRWLEVQAPPSKVWQWIEDFVKKSGLHIAHSDPRLGLLETDWLFTAKPLTHGVFAPVVADRSAASVADRYLIRLEEGTQAGSTDIFIAHRRVARNDQGEWRLRGEDPFLEAEFMRALLVDLGGRKAASLQRIAQGDTSAAQPQLRRLDDKTPVLVLHDHFFEAWRRVGLALDRAGFTVVDRDRSARHYFVRYDTRAELGPKDKGFWETLAFWRNDIPDTVEKYRIDLTEDASDTQVTVHRFDGTPAAQDIAGKMLGLLEDKLR